MGLPVHDQRCKKDEFKQSSLYFTYHIGMMLNTWHNTSCNFLHKCSTHLSALGYNRTIRLILGVAAKVKCALTVKIVQENAAKFSFNTQTSIKSASWLDSAIFPT